MSLKSCYLLYLLSMVEKSLSDSPLLTLANYLYMVCVARPERQAKLTYEMK